MLLNKQYVLKTHEKFQVPFLDSLLKQSLRTEKNKNKKTLFFSALWVLLIINFFTFLNCYHTKFKIYLNMYYLSVKTLHYNY